MESARAGGYGGSIALVGAERHLPYNRPPLSKEFLQVGTAVDYFVTEEDLRSGLSVDLRLGCDALALDTARRVVATSGGRFAYDRLIIATGAAPRSLAHLPEIAGVQTLRTIDDAERIRAAMRPGLKIVVAGAGFIGSEIASSARGNGAEVTIVEAAAVPLVRAVGEVVGKAISGLHRRNGTRLLTDTQIESVIGTDSVQSVVLSNGERVDADLLIVGVGAAPKTGWLAGSGIALHPVDGGIVCDSYLQTSVDGVFAAGDVAHWPNGLRNATVRLENWTNAAEQGFRAAQNALFPDRAERHEVIPYFWSDWYGNRIQFVGTANAQCVEFASGDPDSERFIALYRQGDHLVGAATLNEPRKVMALRRLIAQHALVDEAESLLGDAARTE